MTLGPVNESKGDIAPGMMALKWAPSDPESYGLIQMKHNVCFWRRQNTEEKLLKGKCVVVLA